MAPSLQWPGSIPGGETSRKVRAQNPHPRHQKQTKTSLSKQKNEGSPRGAPEGSVRAQLPTWLQPAAPRVGRALRSQAQQERRVLGDKEAGSGALRRGRVEPRTRSVGSPAPPGAVPCGRWVPRSREAYLGRVLRARTPLGSPAGRHWLPWAPPTKHSAWWRLLPRMPGSWGSRELEDRTERTSPKPLYVVYIRVYASAWNRDLIRWNLQLSEVSVPWMQRRFIGHLRTSQGQNQKLRASREERRKRQCLNTKEPERCNDKGINTNNGWKQKMRCRQRPLLAPAGGFHGLQFCSSVGVGRWALPSPPLPSWGAQSL